MAKKLSKAQEKALEYVRRASSPDRVQKDIEYYETRLLAIEDTKGKDYEHWKSYYQSHLDMYKDGWVLVSSLNSRTFEVLAERGYIEYRKQDRVLNATPIDWARLVVMDK